MREKMFQTYLWHATVSIPSKEHPERRIAIIGDDFSDACCAVKTRMAEITENSYDLISLVRIEEVWEFPR